MPTFRYKIDRLRAVGRHRRRRRRHPRHVCRLPHRGRHLRAHRAALCRADERAGRGAPLAWARRSAPPPSPRLLYAFISGGEAIVGRAVVGADPDRSPSCGCLDGVVPAIQAWLKRRRRRPWRHERKPWSRSSRTRRTADRRSRDPAGEGRDQALRRPAGAGRRRPRRARRRDLRPGRAQRLGQDHADQRHLGLLSARPAAPSRSTAPRSAAIRRTRSPAAAWRAPIRSRGRS